MTPTWFVVILVAFFVINLGLIASKGRRGTSGRGTSATSAAARRAWAKARHDQARKWPEWDTSDGSENWNGSTPPTINPATGMSMTTHGTTGVDAGGNPYGTNKFLD